MGEDATLQNQLVLSPQTIVRASHGRWYVHTDQPAGGPPFSTDRPNVLGWIGNFSVPHKVTEMLDGYDAAESEYAVGIVKHLLRTGVLIPAEAATPSAESELKDAVEQGYRHLAQLMQAVYDLAGDLRAMGPAAHTMLADSAIGLRQRIDALLSGVAALQAELSTRRPGYVQGQLRQLGLDANARDLKLHIGCGKKLIDGWVNIDVHPAPLALNLKRGLPLPDRSVRFVFFSHLLEHLYYPMEVKPFLLELRRVLVRGGVLRIVVPDIEKCINAYVEGDRVFFASRRETWHWWPENPTRLEDFLAYAGVGPWPSHLFECHKFGYDIETLSKVLTETGFINVRRSEFMQSAHPELRVDDRSYSAAATFRDQHYSLFVEAVTP